MEKLKGDLAYLEEKFEWKPCSQKDEDLARELHPGALTSTQAGQEDQVLIMCVAPGSNY